MTQISELEAISGFIISSSHSVALSLSLSDRYRLVSATTRLVYLVVVIAVFTVDIDFSCKFLTFQTIYRAVESRRLRFYEYGLVC